MTDGLAGAVAVLVGEIGRLDADPAPGARWSDLRIDSLDVLELVEAVEVRFEVTIPDRVAVRLRGPDDLVAALRTLGACP